MLIRRLLLVLFFLLAQAGALAHGIGHSSHSPADDQDGADHEPVCELCLAFAPVGTGMAGTQVAWAPPEPVPFVDKVEPAPLIECFRPTYRSRDPPTL